MHTTLPIQQNVTLKHLNTFGVEAKANYFVAVLDTQQLIDLISFENFYHIPKFILGEGSNILFTKDYPGLVIKVGIKGIQKLYEDENHIFIEAYAGENWHDFVMFCIERGYAGVENLSLIPGTVGAAPIQNIGAYGVELSNVFYQLKALDIKDGTIKIFSKEECQFSYRDSIFKHSHKDHYIILSVILRLDKIPKYHIDYGNLKQTLKEMQIKELNVKVISDAVIHIRKSKLPDPKKLGNAGSFFKNPIIPYETFLTLKKSFPNIPHFFVEKDNAVKISAAWLIEQCGWKGKRFGDIGVYDKQALILVNYHQGSAKEIQELAEKIQKSVHQQFGILLSPEVIFV